MFVGTHHTQEQKEEKVSDWNHLSLSVAGPARLASGRGRVLALTRFNTCEFENQDATKITSALSDSRINFNWMLRSLSVRTLCLCLVLLTTWFSVFHLFLPAL